MVSKGERIRITDASHLEVLLFFGTLWITVLSLLIFINPTTITITVFPPRVSGPIVNHILTFWGMNIAILPAVNESVNMYLLGFGIFLLFLWGVAKRTCFYYVNLAWAILEIIFWFAQMGYFIMIGPHLLQAGLFGLFGSSAIFLSTAVRHEMSRNISLRNKTQKIGDSLK